LCISGEGDDQIASYNDPPGKDVVGCDSGRDTVYADRTDVVDADCERVFFRAPT
jgi:hypothetical protein